MAPSATALARSALEAAPAGLLTDFDGTLSPIMREPDAARPVAGAVEALEALAARLAVVGVVSGRAAADARRLMGTDRLLVIGNHGLEWLQPGADRAETGVGEGVRRAVALAVEAVPSEQGVEVERKGLSATVHVRKSPEPDAARDRVRAALEAAAIPGIALRPGRMSLELRPSAAGDKGSAVREVVARYGLRGLLVLGDDVTDLDMFRAADELRQAGRLRAAIIGVGAAGEAPPEVEEAADAVVPDPAAVVRLLRDLGS